MDQMINQENFNIQCFETVRVTQTRETKKNILGDAYNYMKCT